MRNHSMIEKEKFIFWRRLVLNFSLCLNLLSLYWFFVSRCEASFLSSLLCLAILECCYWSLSIKMVVGLLIATFHVFYELLLQRLLIYRLLHQCKIPLLLFLAISTCCDAFLGLYFDYTMLFSCVEAYSLI